MDTKSSFRFVRRAALVLAALGTMGGGCTSGGGGSSGSGGSASGGNGSGGHGSGGASSGGVTGSGGKTASGGTTGSGGASSGGVTGSGGASSGGITGSGGVMSSGGAPGSGGTLGSGGAASGGVTASGGATMMGAGGGAAGGAPGSGGATGGSAGGACAKPGVIFCDDFESATVSMPPNGAAWTTLLNPSTNGGKIAVDGTTKAHSGTKSVHIMNNGAYQTFIELKGAPIFPMTSGPVYLRVYMMLGAAMTSGHNTYFKAGPADPTSSNLETRVGVQQAMLMINQLPSDRAVLSNNNYYTDNKPGIVFQPMTWNCVEVFLDPTMSAIDVSVADMEVPDLHLSDWMQSPIGAFRFGFEQYGGPAGDFWYDDIAVGTMPIGCD